MRVLLLTNMPSYHQIELAQAFEAQLGAGNFCLGIYAPISADRLEMNWQDSYQADYLLRYSESSEARTALHKWIESADLVIQGRFPINLLRTRIAAGGLTFAYQERIWKKGFSILRFISRLPHLYKNYWSVNRNNYHLLAAGAYAANDLTRLGMFKNRCWKFGYFIAGKTGVTRPAIDAKIGIVWCGRLMALKQPFKALEIVAGLRDKGVDLHLTMIGGGELESDVKAAVTKMQLDECVELTGWQSVEQVNAHMASADISLMTSNQREGWGLVINEAINNGCFVVANQAAGAARWLVKDGETGIVYHDDQIDQVVERLAELCKDRERLRQMAQQANLNLTQNWSTQAAAQRIIRLSECLLNTEPGTDEARQLFRDGPCSPVC